MITKVAYINGISLCYDDVGEGPAIVLLHGFPLCRSMWRSQIAPLVAAGYRVLVPDLRGFGESEVYEGSYSMELFADDVINLLDDLGVSRALIVGMSMGGYILLNLLERYAERVSGAVFSCTKSTADDDKTKAMRLYLTREIAGFGPQKIADAFLEVLFAPEIMDDRPKLVEEVYGWMANTASRGLMGGLLAMRERRDMTWLLSTISQSCLVIGATEDKASSLESSRMIACSLPHARLAVIPGGGHMVNMELPGDYNRILLEFVQEVVPTVITNNVELCAC